MNPETLPETLFEAERRRLVAVAYRMLGEVAEAEYVVQDAWLKWSAADQAAIAEPAAWLVRVVTRLCLDRLRSARARREVYVGPWLPEPMIEDIARDPLERAEEVSVAFLLALQRLTPLERAVFLLHDVFDQDYGEVAQALGRREATCRQIAVRARAHVRDARPRFTLPQDQVARLVAAFVKAAASADMDEIGQLLADDCVLISDGGGKRSAALRPLVGRDDILVFFKGLAWRHGGMPVSGDIRIARINGYPGVIVEGPDGVETVAFEPDAEGRLAAIYVVRNPEKLRGLATRNA